MNHPTTELAKSRNTWSMLTVAVLATLVAAVAFATARFPGVENDLTQVLTVARNIADGNGIVTDTIYYEEHAKTGLVPAPQTVFPPGQPTLVACLMKCGLNEMTAAAVLSGVGFVLIPVFLWLLCARTGLSGQTCFVVTILWLCMVLAWHNMVARKSDVPFIGLTVVSACWLFRSKGNPLANAAMAGTVAAMALTIRYAGLFFMFASGLLLLADWLRERNRTRFATLLAFCIPAGAMVAGLFYRNYTLVGDVKGGNSYALHKSALQIARNMYWEFNFLSGIDHGRLKSGGLAEWVFVIGIALSAFAFVKAKPWTSLGERFRSLLNNRAATFCLIYSIVTVCMLIVLELNSQPGARDRMYMAMFPFLFCFIGWLINEYAPQSRSRVFKLAVGMLVLAFLLGQANVARARFGTTRQEHHWYNMVRVMDKPMRGTTVLEYLRDKISAGHPLIANEPQRIGEILRRPVVGVPSKLYSSRTWDSEAVRELAERYDVQYILVLTDKNSLEYEGLQFYSDVVERRRIDWADLDFETGNVLLFRVK